MWPELLTIPGLGLRLHSFSVMFLLGCAGALFLAAWRAKREGLDPNDVYDLALWLYPGGLIGARVFFLIQHPETIRGPMDVFALWNGGIVFYGCIAGGLTGSLIFWARRRFPLRAMCDAVAPALALGLGLGRVGCFLNGCCFGGPCDLPWAVRYPAGSMPWGRQIREGLIPHDALHSLAVHPSPLYEAAAALLLIGAMTYLFPKRRRDGEIMGFLMVAYPLVRLADECLRSDEPAVFLGLSAAQLVSLGILGGAGLYWAWLARLPMTRQADGVRADAGGTAAPSGVSVRAA